MAKFQHPTRWNKLGWDYLDWTVENVEEGLGNGVYHDGLDYNWGFGYDDFGQDVFPFADGEVVHAEFIGNGWGNHIWIEHNIELEDWEVDAIRANPALNNLQIENNILTCWTGYGHLKELKVQKGDKVTQEIVIGLLGGTGKSKTKQDWSPHMHGRVYSKKPPSWTGYVNGWSKEKVANYTVDPKKLVSQFEIFEKQVQKVSEWAKEAVEWARETGIMTNWSKPREPMTAERFITVLHRFYKLTNKDE